MTDIIETLLRETPGMTDTQIEGLQERIDIIRHKLKYVESRPAVICIEQLEPLGVAGNWVQEIVSIAGGSSLLAEAGKPSPDIKWEGIQQADPEIMVIMPDGSSIEQAISKIDLLLNLSGFADLKAVKNNRFYIVDGAQHFNHPGPQVADAIEIMAEIIHPKLFSFGYEGFGWIKFSF